MQKHLLCQPEYTEARNLTSKHSLLQLLRQFFKNERIHPKQISKKEKILCHLMKRALKSFSASCSVRWGFLLIFHNILLFVFYFFKEHQLVICSTDSRNWSQTAAIATECRTLFLIKYKARAILEDRSFCQATLSFPSSSQ